MSSTLLNNSINFKNSLGNSIVKSTAQSGSYLANSTGSGPDFRRPIVSSINNNYANVSGIVSDSAGSVYISGTYNTSTGSQILNGLQIPVKSYNGLDTPFYLPSTATGSTGPVSSTTVPYVIKFDTNGIPLALTYLSVTSSSISTVSIDSSDFLYWSGDYLSTGTVTVNNFSSSNSVSASGMSLVTPTSAGSSVYMIKYANNGLVVSRACIENNVTISNAFIGTSGTTMSYFITGNYYSSSTANVYNFDTGGSVSTAVVTMYNVQNTNAYVLQYTNDTFVKYGTVTGQIVIVPKAISVDSQSVILSGSYSSNLSTMYPMRTTGISSGSTLQMPTVYNVSAFIAKWSFSTGSVSSYAIINSLSTISTPVSASASASNSLINFGDTLYETGSYLGTGWITNFGSTVSVSYAQLNETIGTGPASGSKQGSSVSQFNNILAIGAPGTSSNAGSVWIFTTANNGLSWTQRTVLLGTGATGAAQQGYSVSLHGSILAVGGPNNNNSIGATWIFTTADSGISWTQRTRLIGTGNVGTSMQGFAVSLYNNVLAVGGYADSAFQGATWIFTTPLGTGQGTTWTQVTKLVGTGPFTDSNQGRAVCMYNNVLAIGGMVDNIGTGAVWIFTTTSGSSAGSAWTQRTKLLASDTSFQFGSAVSMNSVMLAIGSNLNGANIGATYIFTTADLGTTWTFRTSLIGSGSLGSPQQGSSVSMYNNVLLTGGPGDNTNVGATWVFTTVNNGISWTEATKIIGSGSVGTSLQGSAVSMSSNIIIGGPGDSSSQGSFWTFNNAIINTDSTGAILLPSTASNVTQQQLVRWSNTGAASAFSLLNASVYSTGLSLVTDTSGSVYCLGSFSGTSAVYNIASTAVLAGFSASAVSTRGSQFIIKWLSTGSYNSGTIMTQSSGAALFVNTSSASIYNGYLYSTGYTNSSAVYNFVTNPASIGVSTVLTQTLGASLLASGIPATVQYSVSKNGIAYQEYDPNGSVLVTGSLQNRLPLTVAVTSTTSAILFAIVSNINVDTYGSIYITGMYNTSSASGLTLYDANVVASAPGTYSSPVSLPSTQASFNTYYTQPFVIKYNNVGAVVSCTTMAVTNSSYSTVTFDSMSNMYWCGSYLATNTVGAGPTINNFSTSGSVSASSLSLVSPNFPGSAVFLIKYSNSGLVLSRGLIETGCSLVSMANNIGPAGSSSLGSLWIAVTYYGTNGLNIYGISTTPAVSLVPVASYTAPGPSVLLINYTNDTMNTYVPLVGTFNGTVASYATTGTDYTTVSTFGSGVAAGTPGCFSNLFADSTYLYFSGTYSGSPMLYNMYSSSTAFENNSMNNLSNASLTLPTSYSTSGFIAKWLLNNGSLMSVTNISPIGPAATSTSTALVNSLYVNSFSIYESGSYLGSVTVSNFYSSTSPIGPTFTQQQKLSGLAGGSFSLPSSQMTYVYNNILVTQLSSDRSLVIYISQDGSRTWSQQTKISLTGPSGAYGDIFAISMCNNILAVGGSTYNTNNGATWIFTTPDSGMSWTQRTVLIGTGNATGSGQGSSVSVYNNIIAIGAIFDSSNAGATWIFTTADNGTSWTQRTKLIATGTGGAAQQGASIALAKNILAIGGTADSTQFGAVWIFTTANNGTSWTQRTKLNGSGNVGTQPLQGSSISLYNNVLAMGASNDNAGIGATWIFSTNDSGTTWIQRTKLIGTGNNGASRQGYSVSLYANALAVGGPGDNSSNGSAWIFTTANKSVSWTQQTRLNGTGNSGAASQGASVSLFNNTVSSLGYSDSTNNGAVWIFMNIVSQINPFSGAAVPTGSVLLPTNSQLGAIQGQSHAVRWNSSGTLVGYSILNSTFGSFGRKIMMDPSSGSVYLLGNFSGSCTLNNFDSASSLSTAAGSSVSSTASSTGSMFLIKWNPYGLINSLAAGAQTVSYGLSLAASTVVTQGTGYDFLVDNRGYLYTTGYFSTGQVSSLTFTGTVGMTTAAVSYGTPGYTNSTSGPVLIMYNSNGAVQYPAAYGPKYTGLGTPIDQGDAINKAYTSGLYEIVTTSGAAVNTNSGTVSLINPAPGSSSSLGSGSGSGSGSQSTAGIYGTTTSSASMVNASGTMPVPVTSKTPVMYNSQSYCSCTDLLDNLYITGTYSGPITDVYSLNGSYAFTLPVPPASLIYTNYILKFDSTGVATGWTVIENIDYGFQVNPLSSCLTTDSSGSLYASGCYCGTSNNGALIYNFSNTNTYAASNFKMPTLTGPLLSYIIKWTPLGIANMWTVMPYTSTCYSLAIDVLGNIYATGIYNFNSASAINNFSSTTTASVSYFTIVSTGGGTLYSYIIKWNAAGLVTGSNYIGTGAGGFLNAGFSLKTDSLNNVYASGLYCANPLVTNLSNQQRPVQLSNISSTTNNGIYIIKWDPDGLLQGTTNLGPIANTNSDNIYSRFCPSITIDSSDNLYVAGYYTSTGTMSVFNFAVTSFSVSWVSPFGLPINSSQDIFIVKWNSLGIATGYTVVRSSDTAGVDGNYMTINSDKFGSIYLASSSFSTGTVNTFSFSSVTGTLGSTGASITCQSGANVWTTTGSMNIARAWYTSNLLLDGTVLIAGGITSVANSITSITNSCEVYNPNNRTWSTVGSLNTGRSLAAATLLNNGTLLIVGGRALGDTVVSSCEIYDPSTGLWTTTGSMNTARAEVSAVLLQVGPYSGFVVVTCGASDRNHGTTFNTWELYNPSSAVWTSYGTILPMYNYTTTLLPDGGFMIAGGGTGVVVTATSVTQRYNPYTNVWTRTSNMGANRLTFCLKTFPSGQLIATGLNNGTNTEIYNPVNNTWAATGSMSSIRDQLGNNFMLLPDGRVYVYGGTPNGTSPQNTSEYFNPQIATWSTGPLLPGSNQFQFNYQTNGLSLVLKNGTGLYNNTGSSTISSACFIYSSMSTTNYIVKWNRFGNFVNCWSYTGGQYVKSVSANIGISFDSLSNMYINSAAGSYVPVWSMNSGGSLSNGTSALYAYDCINSLGTNVPMSAFVVKFNSSGVASSASNSPFYVYVPNPLTAVGTVAGSGQVKKLLIANDYYIYYLVNQSGLIIKQLFRGYTEIYWDGSVWN